jgi:multidrug efflux system outer membrane protein
MIKRILFLCTTLVLLGGCSLIPDYLQPQAPIPTSWPQGAAYNDRQTLAPAITVKELKRQEFFNDPHLLQIIELALANNRDLRLAALNVERARALYGVQRAELFPAIDAAGAGGKQRLASDLISPGTSRSVEQYSIDLGIASWEIDFFGRIRSLKEQALEAYLATDQARRSVQIALISEVAKVYLTLAADRENLELSRSTLKDQLGSYKLIRRQFEVGIKNELDLHRAQTQVDSARRNVALYTRQTAQDRNALNLLAGLSVTEILLPIDLSSVIPPKEIFAGLPSEALLLRPDILAAEHQLKSAYAYIGAARAAFFPRISLTTMFGTASDELSGLFGSGSGTWNFTPQIAMPIFDARIWAAYRVSKAEREIALTEYEKIIQVAFREVADALAVQGTVDQQITAQKSLTEAVAETYRLANLRYSKGIDSYLSVLDAHRSLYGAQQGLISLRLVKFVNQVQFYTVLGGGGE